MINCVAAFFDQLRPETPWLETRKKELGLPTEAEMAESGPVISRRYFVGGLVKLEGARYFWLFSGIMLAAAILFVIVAKLYRTKEFFHDEVDEESSATRAREEGVGL